MEKKTKKFLEFNGQTIYFLAVDGTYWIAIKPICDAIGVNYNRQFQNLKSDPIFGSAFAKQQMQVGEDQPRKYVSLPEEWVYGWLISIRSNNPDLIAYKKECYHLLWEHFRGTITRQELQLKRKYLAEERIKKIENKLLMTNDEYQELLTMRRVIKQSNSELRKQTKEIVETQIELWKTDGGFDAITGEVEGQEEGREEI